MADGNWLEINASPGDAACRTKFVEILHAMDPRYAGMTEGQLKNWLTSGVKPYDNLPAQAFGWFVAGTDKTTPGGMQLVLLCQYDVPTKKANWLTFGWLSSPTSARQQFGRRATVDVLNQVLDLLVEQLARWMSSLQPANPTVSIVTALRPHSMGAQHMAKLYERGFWSLVNGERRGAFVASIHRQHTSIDVTYLEIKITPAVG